MSAPEPVQAPEAAAADLLRLLDIEPLEVNLFRGHDLPDAGARRIFGGLVIAQALLSAYRTVEERLCHSLHAYFIGPGDPQAPVIYQVDRARDGGSFTTRRVVAVQHGVEIFNLTASFHIAEDSWQHQHPMPQMPPPEDCPDRRMVRARETRRLPDGRVLDFLRDRTIEVREVSPRDLRDPAPEDDRHAMWFRMARAAAGQGPAMQQCLLAYASDMGLLGAALRPHGLTWFDRNLMSASLDHAMWFHGPVRFETWHLYAMDAPFTGGGRGFTRGTIYDDAGRLVASVAQEGLLRRLRPAQD